MKPFNLKEYIKNPNRELVTGIGRKARIICTNRKDADYPIVALISNEFGNGESTLYYTMEGKFYTDSTSSLDLFFASEKHEGWVNLYKSGSEVYTTGGGVYFSKEQAEVIAGPTCIATIKIEWEE